MTYSWKLLASFLLTGSMVSTSAVAQTRFCLGGDLDHLSASQRSSCSAALQAVRGVAASLHAPGGWHFVVVCGEDGWKQYAAFSLDADNRLENASADTSLDGHETFFRERDLQGGTPRALLSIVAHEVARIQLQTKEEQAVQSQMLKLLEQPRAVQGM